MKAYTLITQSAGKLKEFQEILGPEIKNIALDLPEIQSVKVEEVVKVKLQEAYKIVQQPVMVEDTGLYIRVWNDFPGALVKWILQTVGSAGICKMLQPFDSRSAYAQTIVGIYDGLGEPQFFAGTVEGRIAEQPKGEHGFGWDDIFIPAGAAKTFGEMEMPEKIRYSMRKKALDHLAAYLDPTPPLKQTS